jgi:hypothetical protein
MTSPEPLLRALLSARPPIAFADEIAALERREKAMSMFVFPDIDPGAATQRRQLIEEMRSLGLSIFQYVKTMGVAGNATVVLAMTPGESWRGKAYQLLDESHQQYRWTDSAEVMRSTLLGYTKEHIARHLDFCKRRAVDWGVVTVFGLTSGRGGRGLNDCHGLSFAESSSTCVAFPRGNRAPVRHPQSLIRKLTFFRVGIAPQYLRDLFPYKGEVSVATTTLTRAGIRLLNSALTTNIQKWTDSGWKSIGVRSV